MADQSSTVVVGDFEWDVDKERSNVRKHKVAFREALTAFADDRAITAPEIADPSRFVLIGMSDALRVLFVVSCEVGERVRIISARKASAAQRRIYEHGSKRRD
jgi:uncharacterized DUF497 family protein